MIKNATKSWIKTLSLATFALLFVFSISACVSRQYRAPGYEGQVYDSSTGEDLAGVEITREQNSEAPRRVAITDTRGRFRLPAETDSAFGIGAKNKVYQGSYLFTKPGYLPKSVSYTQLGGDGADRQAPELEGVISLQPL